MKTAAQAQKELTRKYVLIAVCVAVILVCAAVLSVLALFPQKFQNRSFSSNLKLADACIQQNQYKDAESLLKKAEKQALSDLQRIAIIKRYYKIGDTDSGERFSAESLKQLPESAELHAVNAYFLLQNGKFTQAKDSALKLKDTDYSGLYSQWAFAAAKETGDYYSPELTEVYALAAETDAKNRNLWLQNAAVLCAQKGKYLEAAKFAPDTVFNPEECLFWALISYDAALYAKCIDYGSAMDSPLLNAISADAWLTLGEYEHAARTWQLVLDNNGMSAPIYKNLARYYRLNGQEDLCQDLLFKLVTEFPDYAPGLTDYGHFAEQSSLLPQESAMGQTLRDNGLRTARMTDTDQKPRIPVSDALYRMKQSLDKADNPDLLIEYTKLKWASQNTSEMQCRSELWLMLEETRSGADYQSELVHFAVTYFLRHHFAVEAESLFDEYITTKYGDISRAEYAGIFNDWECELAGYFALKNGNSQEAQILLENFVYLRHIPLARAFSSVMNLGSLYYSINRSSDAYSLYSDISSLIRNDDELSDVQYRLARIQCDRGENKNALQSLSYSLELNPDNHRARQLFNTIR